MSVASSSRSSPPATPSDTEDEAWSQPDQATLDIYNQLVTSRLPPNIASVQAVPPVTQAPIHDEDHVDLEDGSGSSRPTTKAEKQNAKKKRRKERERDEKADMVKSQREKIEKMEAAKPVSFRLFSSCPVQPVSLLPALEEYPIPPNPIHLPLPARDLARIRQIASSSAFTYDDLELASSDFHDPPHHGRIRRRNRNIQILRTHQPLPIVCTLNKGGSGKADKRKIPSLQVEDPSVRTRPKRQRTKRPRRVLL